MQGNSSPKSRTEIEMAHLGDLLARWCDVCAGELCLIGVALLDHWSGIRGFRLCRTCWPNPTEPYHAVYTIIMGVFMPWSICFCLGRSDKRRFRAYGFSGTPWRNVWRSYPAGVGNKRDSDLLPHIKQFGHASTYIILNDRQYKAMVEAAIRDPRSAGEKRQAPENGKVHRHVIVPYQALKSDK